MPLALLPASAAAFSARSSPNVVLNSKPEPWLTQTLKRINRIKRPLNNVTQHQRCLTETLSGPNAIWTLCSLMLPKAPESELRRDDNPLVEALFNYQLMHVEAYVVHVDMVSQNEVAFKLTPETIESLVEYHKDIFSVDTAARTWSWSEKEQQLKKLHDDFVQAINRFVFRTNCQALEGLEEDGAGELLQGRAEEAKNQIMGLFLPLLPPPPPRQVDVVRQAPILPSSTGADVWWQQPPTLASSESQDSWFSASSNQSTVTSHASAIPSSPSSISSVDSCPPPPNMWPSMAMAEFQQQQQHTSIDLASPHESSVHDFSASPEPLFAQPFVTTSPDDYYSPEYFETAMTAAMNYTPILSIPMADQPNCGSGSLFGGNFVGCGNEFMVGNFNWDRYNEYTSAPFTTTM